jgi:GNAT superfamily N-acetyltransferase
MPTFGTDSNRDLYIAAIRVGCLYGESWVVVRGPGNEIVAAAFWIPAPGAELTPERLERSGMAGALAVWGSENWERLETSLAVIDAAQERAAPPHWYLVSVGVDPSWQSHGYGGALLEHFALRAAADRVPACLWTMQPVNVPFYRSHGFVVAAEGAAPESGLPFWIFRRDAIAP